ncbi:ABC transporter substrate-binding protein [Sulfobacillus harzensis]|uniref:ABC transporter substrate-binding protein n=1 Tax=Sulfobacillus harzensis TaxID=2729629 RepID=A0A7Y0L6L6_9FIRM|nr:ABC transporter substrate-binding protein [Sulfobacillus harzensis]NMP23696.1 ABC transporter substrate-binding protein [Sulfobacillus harzensis]
MHRYPERIVCLASEIPGILAELGALDRVVGISAYTTYPEEALNIPTVSGFQHGSVDRIMGPQPDLVILTSTVQLKLAAGLAERGASILHLNPHRLEDLFGNVRLLGATVGEAHRAESLVRRLQGEVDAVRQASQSLKRRPRVYFEEWMDPLIAGVGWVSDLIDAAGGIDIFRERALRGRLARDRVVAPEEWIAAQPDIIFASWCGKPFELDQMQARSQADQVPALQTGRIFEVDGTVLECGIRLVDRLQDMARIIREAVS